MATTNDLLQAILAELKAGSQRQASGGAVSAGRGPSLAQREQQSFLGDVRDKLASSVGLGNGIRGLGASLAVGVPLAAAGAAAGLVAGGITAEARGGNFAHGVQRTALNALAAIPVLGDLTGARSGRDILRGAEGDINATTNQVARFGGAKAVTPEVRAYLAREFVRQNKNVEEDRRMNEAAINSRIGDVTGTGGFAAFESALGKLADKMRAIVGSTGGAGRHT